MRPLLSADGLIEAGFDEESWPAFVERVAETLNMGPGTRVWDVTCGAGSFLFPLHLNGYVVGGNDASAEALALAREAMPEGRFTASDAIDVDPAEPWDVVVASRGLTGCQTRDEARALLARMAAKATHAIALLRVDEVHGPALDRANLLRVLVEIGVSAIQFEGDGRLNIYARVNPGDPLL
jgi:ubiquinone/menaquinone biosynthesis C-methylase UbiE